MTADGPLEEQAVESVIDLAVQVIENREPEATCEINKIEYKVKLKDYYQGQKILDISKQDIERWFNNEIFSPDAIQALLSAFDEEKISPGSQVETSIKFIEEGEVMTKGGAVFDFNFPTIDEKYYDRIINTTLRSGREDLKGRSPSVLFLHLPAYETEDMRRYCVQEGQYDPTPQIQRLEQRIEGELNHSTSVNAVVLNMTYFATRENYCQIERAYKVSENQSPDRQLPQDFRKYLSGDLFNSEHIRELK
ncbi:hypothetical protein [Halobacteriaceae bacterium SHR40]|uniref:hypothetical protein n=1 Tax=Halovenus amylolytica TaxID=2500550 RepID=UPI000FE44103